MSLARTSKKLSTDRCKAIDFGIQINEKAHLAHEGRVFGVSTPRKSRNFTSLRGFPIGHANFHAIGTNAQDLAGRCRKADLTAPVHKARLWARWD